MGFILGIMFLTEVLSQDLSQSDGLRHRKSESVPVPSAAKISELAILWFYEKAHVELQINQHCYDLCWGYLFEKRPIAPFIERARSSEGSPFIRFQIRAEEGRIFDLQQQLNQPELDISRDFCSGTVAQLINQHTQVKIPFFAARTPASLGYYLLELSKRQGQLIRMEHFGPAENKIKLTTTEDKITDIFLEIVIGLAVCPFLFSSCLQNCCSEE